MDFGGPPVFLLAPIYSGFLLVISVLKVAWLFDLFNQTDAGVAGIWFAISCFGFLVFITFVLIHLSRD